MLLDYCPTAMMTVRLGTRGSKLALARSAGVAALLEGSQPGLKVDLVVIGETGSREQDSALPGPGGRGALVKEIEEALLGGRIDLAVHSLRDVATFLPEGLVLAGFPEREDPHDLLVTRDGGGLDSLRAGARVATGSPHRRAQLLARRPDLRFIPPGGSLEARLRRLEEGLADALVLAAARVARLGLRQAVRAQVLPEDICLPSPGQGIVAMEAREEDEEMREQVAAIGDPTATVEACAERGFLAGLGGDCLLPVAALARFDGRRVRIKARILSPDGVRCASGEAEGRPTDAYRVGADCARLCLDRGGREMLAEAEGAAGPEI